ncbi:MAG: CHAD domain-containing protein [Pseudomonadota bacterium]
MSIRSGSAPPETNAPPSNGSLLADQTPQSAATLGAAGQSGVPEPGSADICAVMEPFVARARKAAQTVVLSDDPEGPHQLRVGLRKARTALNIFGRRDPQAMQLANEARDIATLVGGLRDLDVVRLEILGPHLARHPSATGFQNLNQALLSAAAAERVRVRAVVTSGRVERLLAGMDRWMGGQAGRPAAPPADKALRKRFRKAQSYGWRFSVLRIETRHTFRKELKKLRYTLDSGAWPTGGQDRQRFVKRLRKIQNSLGAMNDAAVAEIVLDRTTVHAGPAARAASAQIQAALAARSDRDVKRTSRLWQKVERAAPDWF